MNKFVNGFLLCFPMLVWGQTNVGGSAPISFLTGPTDCNGYCVTVAIFVDVTGLQGTADPAGLNSFVLAFDLDRSDVFASVTPGVFPVLDWDFFSTSRDRVEATNRLVMVGAVGDSTAPNQKYHVANVTLCGSTGPVTFTFVPGESSLGSRVVNGDGPGPITIDPPAPFQASIVVDFPLNFADGITSWLQDAPDYDLVPPTGNVDISDLVKLINCGLP